MGGGEEKDDLNNDYSNDDSDGEEEKGVDAVYTCILGLFWSQQASAHLCHPKIPPLHGASPPEPPGSSRTGRLG